MGRGAWQMQGVSKEDQLLRLLTRDVVEAPLTYRRYFTCLSRRGNRPPRRTQRVLGRPWRSMSGRLEGFQKASLTTESEGAPVSVIPPSIIKPLADVSDPAANSTDTAATGRVHSGRDRVEDFVGAQVQECDPNQMLDVGDFQEVIEECSSKVLKVMDREKRSEMDEEDQAFIVRRVHKMVAACFEQ